MTVDPDWLKKARAEGRILNETGVRPVNDALGVPNESEFQQAVIDYARSLDYRAAHFRTVRIARADGSTHYATPVAADGAGFPDLLIVGHGRIIAWELKVGNNRPTPEQVEWIFAFKAAGAFDAGVYWPKDWPRMREVLEWQ